MILPGRSRNANHFAALKRASPHVIWRRCWAALEKVVGSEPRIKQVAADLVQHFEERDKAQSGKAMVVAMSRDICAHLYNAIVALRPDSTTTIPKRA